MYIRNPKCLEIFLGFGYQRYTHALWLGRAFRPDTILVVFALGEDETGNHQACASVSALQVGVSDPDKLAAMAIARCNEFGARWGINCKLFAVENEIVWGKEEDVEFK